MAAWQVTSQALGTGGSPRRWGLGHQQYTLQAHPCNLGAGDGQSHLKVCPFFMASPFSENHSEMLAQHHPLPSSPWPLHLLQLRLWSRGWGHTHGSVSRREHNAGGKNISGSINASHGEDGCAGAGLGTRICLQR